MASHEKQKLPNDLQQRPVEYVPRDLVRLKTHPRSDSAANFAAQLAPLYGGPYRIMQWLSEINYRLASVDGAQDFGVVYVVNLQPFHTWQTAEAHTTQVPGPSGSDVGDSSLGVQEMMVSDDLGLNPLPCIER